jgi:hypothetical protein
MTVSARAFLEELFRAADKKSAGVRKKDAVLTEFRLNDYRNLPSLQIKEGIEHEFRMARDAGAIALEWDRPGEKGFIRRITLVDADHLANYLGIERSGHVVARARESLVPFLPRFPVLNDVIARWGTLKKVRMTNASQVAEWLDAIRAVEALTERFTGEDTPIREASARLFNDSKRLEKLTGPLDTLLTGSIEMEARLPAEVWKELGLFREEQPVLLAGRIELARSRLSALIDQPYGGFASHAVLGVSEHMPSRILTIENLTTFHSEARRGQDADTLMIYTAGMPSPAWRAMYRRILASTPATVPLFHWGDVDEGGFRIASVIAGDARLEQRTLLPFRMAPEDIPIDVRRTASPAVLERMRTFAGRAGWPELGERIQEAGFTVEQESLS